MKILRNFVAITIAVLMFNSCDYFVAGSNLYGELYEFKMSKDTLIQKLRDYNAQHTNAYIDGDSVVNFEIDESNPSFYVGSLVDVDTHDYYTVLIWKAYVDPSALMLISVQNMETGEMFVVNEKPQNKHDIEKRKIVMKNFERGVLNKIGLGYEHVGNRMGKDY